VKRNITIRDRGFTIIEILIVLAIAGLILTIVFIAVPQLQRNARDNQRQAMVARLKTELETFSANNQGQYPFLGANNFYSNCRTDFVGARTCRDWLERYIQNGNVNIKDPTTGQDIDVYITINPTLPLSAWHIGAVWISVGNRCSGEQFAPGPGGGANSKSYAIAIALERNGTYYCIDNG